MILLLGSTGYVGQAFAHELQRRGQEFSAPTRKELDYTCFDAFLKLLRGRRPHFVVNAAGYTGKPNVDACETARADTLQGNTLVPQMLAHACALENIPWGHVSSGCIFSGAKVTEGGATRIEKDLTVPAIHDLFLKSPEMFSGFSESDVPNFSFRAPPCSFYSGTKALGEEAIEGVGQSYIWRLRIPFDQFNNQRNYLSKIQNYAKVYENINSLSHRGDFVRACLDLWEKRAPFGIYNVTNPGAVSTIEVIELVRRILKPNRAFEFWRSDEEFYRFAAKAPRSNCIIDVSKILATGVQLRPVRDALEDSLKKWC
ncbi:MAG TPA: sugar nucleotide-binding protein [Pyrinomonadaceae bacterium]|nr:sugar nucleotide-binding protein [Pyrinomonadaceae bacterium]